MKSSTNVISFVKIFDECHLYAWEDVNGVWSIGYRHTNGVKPKDSITKSIALAYLKKDLLICEEKVLKYENIYHWNQNQFDALVSFTFSGGDIDSLTEYGKRTIQEISSRIPAYIKLNGRSSINLIDRRHGEKRLFDTPVDEIVDEGEFPAPEKYNPLVVRAFRIAWNEDHTEDKKIPIDGVLDEYTMQAIRDTSMNVGDTGAMIRFLQDRLTRIMPAEWIKKTLGRPLDISGYFDDKTRKIVIDYQKRKNITMDGVVGPETILSFM